MRLQVPLLLLLAACAGPSAHRTPALQDQPEAVRAKVATTLSPADPLAAPNCGLPTSPNGACPRPEQEQQHEHGHQPNGAQPPPAPEAPAVTAPARVTDPVCKMKIDPKTAKGGTLTHEGTQHWFCSSSCRNAFLTQNPGAK